MDQSVVTQQTKKDLSTITGESAFKRVHQPMVGMSDQEWSNVVKENMKKLEKEKEAFKVNKVAKQSQI